ncbi:MAG: DUF4124 domain-containing protein [Candidatus Riflebacteria bacterium]|nr:DUF4124 domain-containing protein [Candidatus Riflebacteria bacterium]
MKKLFFIILFSSVLFSFNNFALAEDHPVTTEYSFIESYAPFRDIMNKELGPGEEFAISANGLNAYIVKSVTVTDEQQLINLMGASSEANLTDAQKGLLEVFRFSKSEKISQLKSYIQPPDKKITLQLNDITGYEDEKKYPTIKKDFWPRLAKNSTIVMSAAPYLHDGKNVSEMLPKVLSHELGHVICDSRAEPSGYGSDGSHYLNEIIGPQAAFAEGFADFTRLLCFPEEEKEYRGSLNSFLIESQGGKYVKLGLKELSGKDLLNNEGIDALILSSLAKEIPNGKDAIIRCVQRNNSQLNPIEGFLYYFVKENPSLKDKVCEILKRETSNKLSDDEISKIFNPFGNNTNTFLDLTSTMNSKPAMPKMYQWVDKNGEIHFSDEPPSPNESGVIMLSPSPKGNPTIATYSEIHVDSKSSNPFGE